MGYRWRQADRFRMKKLLAPACFVASLALGGCAPKPTPEQPAPPRSATPYVEEAPLPQPLPPKIPAVVVDYEPLTGIAEMALGYDHSCARLNDGTVRCWGNNGDHQLGNNTREPSLLPQAVAGIEGATHIIAGYHNTCVVVKGGSVKCWGLNYSTANATIITAPTLRDVVQLSGTHYRLFARRADGSLHCFNIYGCDPDNMQIKVTPVEQVMPNLADVASISSHWDHQCLSFLNGTVKCWGAEMETASATQGTMTSVKYPTEIPGLTGVAQVAAGVSFACARLSDGKVKCWGSNWSGRLGAGEKVNLVKHPVFVSGLSGAIGLCAGDSHSCALTDHGVFCWGSNSNGQMGPTGQDQYTPVAIPIAGEVVEVACGSDYNCARLKDTTASCWGANYSGQLGNGNQNNSSSPMPVHAGAPAQGRAIAQ